ncbi:MAG: esterase [Burkholderiaceae bacterium]|nr:esterase [Burkholderiaceae bacterium]
MTAPSLIIQQPAGPAQQLVLLFHGWGSSAASMLPLGERLASAFPNAMVVAINAPDAAAGLAAGLTGYQWFGIQGVTEENRQSRVDAAIPAFVACIEHWQAETGVPAEATALIGVSQGAIMALEASKLAAPMHHAAKTRLLFGRMLSICGRFATLPSAVAEQVTIHLLHGKDDAVIPYSHAVNAAHHLRDLGGDVTAEVLPFIGHEIHPEFIELAISKLSSHIPHRVWAKAVAEQNSAPETPKAI